MGNLIKIIGVIKERIEIFNKANIGKKNTQNLFIDNKLYVKILDENTSLISQFFEIPDNNLDVRGVDLIYKSPKIKKDIFIDIKTQTNITNKINLYLREFNKEKIENRNYIIFNKQSNFLFGNIYFIDENFIQELRQNNIFNEFLNQTHNFGELTYNLITQIKKEEFKEYKNKFNNKEFEIKGTKVKIIFLSNIRKDKKGIIGNTSFKENIKIEIYFSKKIGH